MLKAEYIPYTLDFIRPAGTSRGVLASKAAWYIRLEDEAGCRGMGEVTFIPGLSVEDGAEMDIRLDHICKLINRGEMDPLQDLPSLPGVRFALDTAMSDLENGGQMFHFSTDFTRGKKGIPINGLIWMGGKDYLLEQIREKHARGFRVLKIKVGALDFASELEVVQSVRREFGKSSLEIRLDANGAWSLEEAREKLAILGAYHIHSIEQPLPAGQIDEMASLCKEPFIPVALDEELIGIAEAEQKAALLDYIRPQYVILKPGLLGGFSAADEWLRLAEKRNIGWWCTSALESNIGLSALAQWAADRAKDLPQGLGTGQLYTNNIPSPLRLEADELWHGKTEEWDFSGLSFKSTSG